MWWLLVLLFVGLIVWAHCARGMNLKDRIEVALEIVRTSPFAEAEGFTEASREDPNLVGWLRAGKDCVMLFRSVAGEEVHEVIDIASLSFHPGLIVKYVDGRAITADGRDIAEERMRKNANKLLRETRQLISLTRSADDFGFRE